MKNSLTCDRLSTGRSGGKQDLSCTSLRDQPKSQGEVSRALVLIFKRFFFLHFYFTLQLLFYSLLSPEGQEQLDLIRECNSCLIKGKGGKKILYLNTYKYKAQVQNMLMSLNPYNKILINLQSHFLSKQVQRGSVTCPRLPEWSQDLNLSSSKSRTTTHCLIY